MAISKHIVSCHHADRHVPAPAAWIKRDWTLPSPFPQPFHFDTDSVLAKYLNFVFVSSFPQLFSWYFPAVSASVEARRSPKFVISLKVIN